MKEISKMEEYVDILDEITGEKTGEVITKKEAHKTGKWHSAVHIWIISEDKKRVLLQKRCPDKNLFPNMWDISVGGHDPAGASIPSQSPKCSSPCHKHFLPALDFT